MSILRRTILAITLIAGIAPAIAQVPPPVPALPDTERRTSYSITASTCACAVNMALYGDSTDYQNWVEIFLNGARVNFNDPTFGWVITSPTGPIGNIARPITDAVLTFNSAQTGTVQIVGARRPRRVSQFSENQGVSARNLNQVITDIVAMLREAWDKINDATGRGLFFPPGNTTGPMPQPSACENAYLAFDATGLNPTCVINATGPSGITAGTGISITGTNPVAISTSPAVNNTIMGNISGSTASPTAQTPSGIWNAFCSTTVGNIWVRLSSGWGCLSLGYANPVWWGADPTGTNDSASAFNSALAVSNNILFPPGKFKFNSAINFTLPNSIASLSIAGAGMDVTELTWPTGSGISLALPNINNTFHFHDLTFSSGAANSGNGVTITRTSTNTFENVYASDFTNVTFRGADAYPGSDYWGTAVDIVSQSDIVFNNFNVIGPNTGGYTTVGIGVNIVGVSTAGLVPVQYVFSNSNFQSIGAGIIFGAWAQGLQVSNSNFTGGTEGIFVPGSTPGLVYLGVANCQFNNSGGNIFTASTVINTIVTGNDIYTQPGGFGVLLSSATGFSIIGNHFNTTSGSAAGVGVQVGTTSGVSGVIMGNVFDTQANGIVLGAGTSGVNVQANVYHTNTTNVSNAAGAANSVGVATQ